MSDRKGRKPFVVLGSLLTVGGLVGYCLAALVFDWRLLVPAVLLFGLSSLSRPAMNSVVAESVDEGERGMAYSLTMMFFIVPGVAAPLVGGYLADVHGYSTVFGASLFFEGMILVLILWYLKETMPPSGVSVSLGELVKSLREAFRPVRGLRWFYGTMALDAFSWGLGATILFGLLEKEFDFTSLQFGTMASVFSISWAASQLVVGRLIRRYGAKGFLAFSEALGLVLMSGWLLSSVYDHFLILEVIYGLIPAAWAPAMLTYMANSVPDDRRAEAMGKLAAFRGLISFPAPIMGGILYDAMGFTVPILANLVGAAVCTVLITLFLQESRPLA